MDLKAKNSLLATFSENPKLDLFSGKDSPGKTLLEKGAACEKGKEAVDSENSNQDEKWVERDLLNLSESKGTASKRQAEEDFQESEKRPKLETLKSNLRILESKDGGKPRKISRPERILREILSESIISIAQTIHELPEETLELTKEYLRNLISTPEKKAELVGLQNRLEMRSDLTKETLSKCHKDQLKILVAVRTSLKSFLSRNIRLPMTDMIEIFLFMRCRNMNCKSLLPVDDYDCKICSGNKGFCSSCMCPICLNFDCASNTCSWIDCDVCSHWCHVACGMQKNLIKPGPSLKGPSGTTEMQIHYIGCGHASEMFGFVKDVFLCCAKEWGPETLIKELDCVRKIFRGSDDSRGKDLHIKAEELFIRLQNKMMPAADVCNTILWFFNVEALNTPPLSR
ncbi:hypothetical protein V6N13_029614 [Hibiscus sabdariffa]|uniref:Uncharacterized protein n=2 Tax=Hibiscus sabdariffa TaxID=183260 RepID=A0ABR2AIH9_9ROSI